MSWTAGDPQVTPIRRSRLSLRVRLIGLVLLVAVLALAVVDVVLPGIARRALLESRDQSLSAVINSLSSDTATDYLERLSAASPLKSGVGWSLVYQSGKVRLLVPPADGDHGPALSNPVPAASATVPGSDARGGYRILSRQVLDADLRPATLVVWTNLEDIDNLLDRLVFTELLITAGLLILLGSLASLLIRRELKPLEEMADVADSIAAGDLSRRVAVHESGVEVDRLGIAFNGMLDGIDGLLADRRAAEHRLRQFVADASHELRTPVAAVRGYTDLYAAGALPEPPAVGRAMQRMGFESRRMGALVEDLLTLVQADTPDALIRENVDLVEVLRGVVEDAAAIDGDRTWTLSVPTGADPVLVSGDRHRLHQLFANLLGNIRTHTAAGTAATVGFEPDADPRFVTVTVADNGSGVDPDSLPYLFDRFYRADPSRSRLHGGSGLGLAIVAAIAGVHGGAVSAAHAGGGGLLIRVRLPRA